MGGSDGVWGRVQPSLRFPFVRIGPPYVRVAIRSQDSNVDEGALRNCNLPHFSSVYSAYRSGEWEYGVCSRTSNINKSDACTGSESRRISDLRSIDQRNRGMAEGRTVFYVGLIYNFSNLTVDGA